MTNTVGRRLEYKGAIGTVRYLGKVGTAPGEWYGIEWDDPDRGKHNGSKDGTVYFTCQAPTTATAGSFVKTTAAGIQWGVAFTDALVKRYLVTPQGELSPFMSPELLDRPHLRAALERCIGTALPLEQRIINDSKDPASGLDSEFYLGDTSVKVQTVGWDESQSRLSQLDKLATLGLAKQNISIVDPNDLDLATKLDSVEALDLSSNLLCDWVDVYLLAIRLPCLQLLRLNHNRFRAWELPSDPLMDRPTLLHLHTLSLNHTLAKWPDVLKVLTHIRGLKHLALGFNQIQTLTTTTNITSDSTEDDNHATSDESVTEMLANLQFLSLEGNALSRWQDLTVLARLPNLETLDLRNNQLVDIEYTSHLGRVTAPPATEIAFPRLHTLWLDDNSLTTWTAVDQLNQFPQLRNLRFKGNPISQGLTPDRVRLLLVGRVGGITGLNGSELGPRERKDLELYYLKLIANDFPTLDKASIIQVHPRYPALVQLYGAPIPATLRGEDQRTIHHRLIQLTIGLTTTPQDATLARPITKNILVNTSIRALRLVCCRLFHLRLPVQLVYRSANDVEVAKENHDEGPTPSYIQSLDDDFATLQDYRPIDGGQILVTPTA
ncbi:hypothetical protein IWQ62_001076 [Dispira parvispora]|uniref:CAP-Gly domain-containing protein n=1 Tax=Dispira parvispora TaxID=1520584 RepID=A0A9W8AT57_9FUNG|nr:hypothetical protein IWQ62_001076 [Dispira parvispora]